MSSIIEYVQQLIIKKNEKITNDNIKNFIEKLCINKIQVKIHSTLDDEIPKQKKVKSIIINPNNKTRSTSKTLQLFQKGKPKKKESSIMHMHTQILNKLRNIPIYSVVNEKNEMISSCPKTTVQPNLFQWIKKEIFLSKTSNEPLPLSLFFLNKEDASLYLHEISGQKPKDAETFGLKLMTTSMDTFYKIIKKFNHSIEYKLVADLHEMNLLITKFLHSEKYTCNPKQRYSNDWFQGVPVYIITMHNLHEKSPTKTLGHSQYKQVVFFKMEEALDFWLSNKNDSFKYIPLKDSAIEIYNFEGLISDLQNNVRTKKHNLEFLPPKIEEESPKYQILKNQITVQHHKLLKVKNLK